MNKPFTYIIFCKATGQYYYGARWAKTAHPDQLWKTYFTSSKHVKALISQYGKDNFTYSVRQTFSCPSDARRWEERFLLRVKAAQSDVWINQHNGGTNFYTRGGANHPSKRPDVRAKLSKSHTGKTLTDEHKQRIGDYWSGKPKSKEHNMKNSEANLGKSKHTDEQKSEWSRVRKGRGKGGFNPRAKRIAVNGIEFQCVSDAAKYFGISRVTFRKRFSYISL